MNIDLGKFSCKPVWVDIENGVPARYYPDAATEDPNTKVNGFFIFNDTTFTFYLVTPVGIYRWSDGSPRIFVSMVQSNRSIMERWCECSALPKWAQKILDKFVEGEQ